MYHQQPHKPNAQTSSRHRSHYQVDTDINSEWKLQTLPLEPDIEIPDQPLEEIEKESSGSEENVESSDSDKKVEKNDSDETVEYDIQEERDWNPTNRLQRGRNKPKCYREE